MTHLDLLLFASHRVSTEILGKRLLEHQGNAFSHHADCIHGIDQGFSFGLEKVTLREGNH